MKKVILIVLNNFINDSRVLKEAVTLQENGFNVRVIALHEGDLKEFDTIEGVAVHRIKLKTRFLPKLYFIQIIKYMEFFLEIVKKYRKVNIIHANDLGPLPIAVFIKKVFNKKMKVIYDAHEYERERNGLKGLRKKVVGILEKTFIKNADSVITVSGSIAEEYAKLYNIPTPYIVLNCPNYKEQEEHNIFRSKFDIPKETTIFLYQGGLTKGRKIEEYLNVFSAIDNAALVLMGYGPLEELVIRYANKYKNIHFQEAVSPTTLLKYTSSADIGLCYIESTCLSYYYCLPNKFFEYIMAGLPTLTNNIPELREKVESYEVGWVCENDLDEDALKKLVVDSIINNINIQKYAENTKSMSKKYCWEEQEKVLLDAYYER